ERLPGLRLVTVGVPAWQEALVAPPQVHPRPVDGVAGPTLQHLSVDGGGDPPAGEDQARAASNGLCVEDAHDETGRCRLGEELEVFVDECGRLGHGASNSSGCRRLSTARNPNGRTVEGRRYALGCGSCQTKTRDAGRLAIP